MNRLNYGRKSIKELVVSFPVDPKLQSVRSPKRGKLAVTIGDDKIPRVTMPLETADYLLLD